MSHDTQLEEYVRASFRKHIKTLPSKEIMPISVSKTFVHSTENKKPTTIISQEPNFAMTTFSTYPIVDGRKQGEPNCDRLKFVQFDNAVLGVIADGCGWGEHSKKASENAVDACIEKIAQNVQTCVTIKDVGFLLVDAVISAQVAILLNSGTCLVCTGTTTLLLSLTLTTVSMKQYTVLLSIGDCRAFLYNGISGNFESIGKSGRKGKSTTDCGSVLGPLDGRNPSLNNVILKCIPNEKGDYVLLFTDGFHDNLDPDICGIKHEKDKFTKSIICPIMKEATHLEDAVLGLSNYIVQSTRELSDFYRKSKSKSPTTLLGKLDHSTTLFYSTRTKEGSDFSKENYFIPNYYEKLYEPSSANLKPSISVMKAKSKEQQRTNLEVNSQPISPSDVFVAQKTSGRPLSSSPLNKQSRELSPLLINEKSKFFGAHFKPIRVNQTRHMSASETCSPSDRATPSPLSFSPGLSFKTGFMKFFGGKEDV
ncbi:hypothetical protein EIN_129850 [Entamoeba invadens IP1]|uniref:PPM-type phosphatase domain-containing protein n=1 Tax=Entamoeba invadens IP1 TaxID=370355 RepID=L7FPN1_ENTIV|nr:hypothetical protein EIN_129850 [Entamoeba invadens IP1]ELP91605.1 hypothetical protein EIN_129850 [Entamoeba invadens IP1]|eukprot:XP_004258376.1 hypothetical protein EIN_129850 [Entamoeba invadens IP1]